MTGVQLITEERREQIETHGFVNDHRYRDEELVDAAIQYLLGPGVDWWPEVWDPKWYKPGNRIEELTRAGALIAAEIDRILRLETEECTDSPMMIPTLMELLKHGG